MNIRYECSWISENSSCVSSFKVEQTDQCSLIKKSPQPLIHLKLRSNVMLRGENLPVSGSSSFKCYIEGKEFSLTVVNKTTAKCMNVQFGNVNIGVFKKDVPIKISNGTYNIDSEDGQPVKGALYDCEKLKNCGLCLYYQYAQYSCQWISSSCQNKVDGRQRSDVCGKPVAKKIEPSSGPVEGGTRVNITVSNLGSNVDDLKGDVKLAGIVCEVEQVSSNSVVCISGKAIVPIQGPVTVWKYDTGARFQYETVSIESLSPNYCFTNLPSKAKIQIRNFHIGSNRKIAARPDNDCINLLKWKNITDQTSMYEVECPQCEGNDEMLEKELVVEVDKYSETNNIKFLPFPHIVAQLNYGTILSGGVSVGFKCNFNVPLNIKMHLSKSEQRTESANCSWSGYNFFCKVPKFNSLIRRTKRAASEPDISLTVGFTAEPNGNLTRGTYSLKVFPDPDFKNFTSEPSTYDLDKFVVYSRQRDLSLEKCTRSADFSLELGSRKFYNAKVYKDVVIFDASNLPQEDFGKKIKVKIHAGEYFEQDLGEIHIETTNNTLIAIAICMVLFVCLVIGCSAIFIVRRRGNLKLANEKRKFEQHLDRVTADTAAAARNAFTAMQTSMVNMSLDSHVLPYREFEEFITHTLVPSRSGILMPPVAFDEIPFKSTFISSNVTSEMVREFDEELLGSKPFLLTLIRTFDHCVKIKERTLLASAVSVSLINRLDYCYDIINGLLQNIVSQAIAEKKIDSLQLLFRGSDYLVEKMFANWLTICLYSHLRNSDTGQHFFLVCEALHTYINQGPVDCFTNRATNVLSEELLLGEELDFQVIPITASLEECEEDRVVSLEILSQDSISQVKNKILEALYVNEPFSVRPTSDQYQLVWKRTSNTSTNSDSVNGRERDVEAASCSRSYYINFDHDARSCDQKTKQIHTIGYFNSNKVLENAHLVLKMREFGSRRRPRHASGHPGTSMAGSLASMSSINDSTALLHHDDEVERWHLCKPVDQTESQISKEFLLPHILKTKEVIKPYVNDLFKSIFHVDNVKEPPQCVWHMFHILDDLIHLLPRDRPCNHNNLLHVWKSNTFILRVWVNLLKNPHFLFDVDNHTTLCTSLSTIAQALMDACSLNTANSTTYKTMPVNKLIYMKDVDEYRKWVVDFYSQVASNPNAPSQQDFSIMLQEMSQYRVNEEILYKAKRFLFVYARNFKSQLLANIETSPWLYTDEERVSLQAQVETILHSNESTSIV